MQAPRLLRSFAVKQLGRRSYTEGHHQVSTISDLPTPQGSWKTHNDAKQRAANAQLAIGIGAIVGAIVFGKAVGFLEFHNEMPVPAKISSYK